MRKKSIIFISSLLVFVLCFSLLSMKGNVENKKVFAEESNEQKVIVIGKSEIEVSPNKMKVNLCVKNRYNSMAEGKSSNEESLENLKSKIKEFDGEANIKSVCSFSRPIFYDGDFFFEFENCFIVDSSKVDEYDTLVDNLKEYENVKIQGVSYSLDNNEEAYKQALLKAKENADEKAKSIFQNVKLISLKEEPVFNFNESFGSEKIRVNAMVRACYSFNNTTNNETSTNVESQDNSSKNISNETENMNEISNNDSSKLVNAVSSKLNNESTNSLDESLSEEKTIDKNVSNLDDITTETSNEESKLNNDFENKNIKNEESLKDNESNSEKQLDEELTSNQTSSEETANNKVSNNVNLKKDSSNIKRNKTTKIPDNTHDTPNRNIKRNVKSNERVKKAI